jgi:hypothetical protein
MVVARHLHDEVSRIVECQDINEGHQLSQEGWGGKDMVRYVERLGNTYRYDWKGLEAGEVREWTEVLLQ